jgi:dienelactone hydrolase
MINNLIHSSNTLNNLIIFSELMKKIKLGIIVIIVLIVISTIGFNLSETDGLTVSAEKFEVNIVNQRTLSATYVYPTGEWDAELPGVVVFHGFSSSKEMMWPIVKILARNGFAVLSVDLQGHGQSTGSLGEDGDSDFSSNSLANDGITAVGFLRSQKEVNTTLIGLVGHSMGASTSIATSFEDNTIKSNVLIGNDLNSESVRELLNTSNPQNMLLAMGTYDELFTVDAAETSLEIAVGGQIDQNILYGDFVTGTARKLIVTPTNHVFEVLDSKLIDESVDWLINSLMTPFDIIPLSNDTNGNSLKLDQGMVMIIGILWLALLALSLSLLGNEIVYEPKLKWIKHGSLFTGSFIVGAGLGTTIFGDIWFTFLGWFAIGSIAFYYLSIKSENNLSKLLNENISAIIKGIGVFLGFFASIEIILYLVPWDIRYVLPLFAELSLHRIPIFLLMWLFGAVFFTIEIQASTSNEQNIWKDWIKVFWSRSWMFIIILLLQYVPILFFGITLLPGILGILAFFVMAIIPMMIILTAISVFAKQKGVSSVITGIVIGGYISWLLLTTLPL